MAPKSEFQNLSFRILRMKQYHWWCFNILFALLSVTVAVVFFISAVLCHYFKAMLLVGILPLKKASSMIFLQCAMYRNTTQVNN